MQKMDVALLSVYKTDWLTEPSNNSDFCRKYTKRSELGFKRCEACHREWENAAIKSGKPMIFTCHVGLTNFALPVIIENQYMGCVLGGQILTGTPNKEYFIQVAKELGIDKNKYLAELKNIKIIPAKKVKEITDLLFIVINSIAAIACAKSQLTKLGLDYKIPKNLIMEEWLSGSHGNVKKPVSSREFEVLKLIVQGKSNVEIAKDLFISVHTVKVHVSSILEKFSVEDRVQLAVKAVREGLI